MAFYDSLNRLKRIDYLIQTKSTGTPQELANKLNISKRWVYEYINMLKELGAPIKYCEITRSYLYEQNGRFLIEFKVNEK